MPPATFFTLDDEGVWFTGTDAARGPWSKDACHAGPIAAALARSVERIVSDKQLVRITINVTRPVPVAGFRIDAQLERDGRQVSGASAALFTREEKVAARAHSLHIAAAPTPGLPTARIPPPTFPDGPSAPFPVRTDNHDLPWFGTSIDTLYPRGQDGSPGPTTIWMRTPALVPDEQMSPFQSLCPLADCGNGISRNAEVGALDFVNPDLTIVMHRAPTSDWIASQAASFWGSNGIGASTATLFDREGAIGAAAQTLLLRKKASPPPRPF